MKIIFKKLANELENATFSYEEYIVDGKDFSKLSILIYSLKILYEGNSIH